MMFSHYNEAKLGPSRPEFPLFDKRLYKLSYLEPTIQHTRICKFDIQKQQ